MKKILSAVVTLLSLSLASQVFAAHPLATDDTGTNGTMKFQAEISAEYARDKQDGIKSDSQSIGLAVTGGLTESIDLSVAVPFTWQQEKNNGVTVLDNSGLNDLSVALKWRFLELGPASFALKPVITFPTGDYDRRLGAGRLAYGATLISTVEFKPVALHANLGYTLQKYRDVDKDGSRDNLWSLSLAGTVEVMKGLQLVAEIGAATDADKGNTTWPAFITGGVIYSARDNLDLSLGVKVGLNKPETDAALLAGVTFKFQ